MTTRAGRCRWTPPSAGLTNTRPEPGNRGHRFGFLAARKIRRGAHKSVRSLQADIRAWVKEWNANPTPFTWTKTAEEILDSLARFCQRISGAGH